MNAQSYFAQIGAHVFTVKMHAPLRREAVVDDLGPREALEKPRTLARRRQVLEAAARCFRVHGFHTCSMAQISAEAGMSVGHIYRYFTGKDAIIAAIVKADVDEVREKIAQFHLENPDLRRQLTDSVQSAVLEVSEPHNAALMIEIRAEASRNPKIRQSVQEADAKISEQLRVIIAAAVGHPLDASELDARVEMFHLIFQGVGVRAIINPHLDRSALAHLVRLTIEAILK